MPNLQLQYPPLNNLVVTSEPGKRIAPLSGKEATHRGMDFRAKSGIDLYNSHDGYVVIAERSSTYGNVVVIRDKVSRCSTLYAHLSQINFDNIFVGKDLTERTLIGKTGNTGPERTQYHLHFEILDSAVSDLIENGGIGAAFGQERLNPRTYIASSSFASMLSTEVHSGELGYGAREGDSRGNKMIRDSVGLYDGDQMIFSGLGGDDKYYLKTSYTGQNMLPLALGNHAEISDSTLSQKF